MTGNALPVTYSPEDVANALGVNADRVRALIREGRVGCLRGSRQSVRLLDRHVQELVAALEVPAKPAGPTAANPFGATGRSAAVRARKAIKPATSISALGSPGRLV